MRFVFALIISACLSFFAASGFADDASLQQKEASTKNDIQSTLGEIDIYRSIDVTVKSGVVNLSGNVSLDPVSKKELVDLVKTFDGVRFVQTDISSSTGVIERLTPAIANVKEKTWKFLEKTPLFLFALFIFVCFWVFSGWLSRKVVGLLPQTKNQTLIHSFTRQFVRIVVIGLGATVVLELLNVTALVGALVRGRWYRGTRRWFRFERHRRELHRWNFT